MAEGYNIGDNPNNISITSINSLYGHTELNLQDGYTFIDPPPSPIVVNQGKVQVIAFAQYNDANSQSLLKELQTINSAHSGDTNPNFNIVGVLYNYGGSIPSLTFNNTVNNILRTDPDPAKQVSYDFLNNPSWTGSPAENFLINYGMSVTSPVIYIISKYYLIAYKTHLGLHAGVAAMIAVISSAVASTPRRPHHPKHSPCCNDVNSHNISFADHIFRACAKL